MHRRLSLFAAALSGAFAAALALPLVSACQHRAGDSTLLAPDAHADTAAPAPMVIPAPAGGGQTASLAPLVKQLRPVVVNISSRFKPHRRVQARRPQQRPSPFGSPNPDDPEEGGDDQQQQDPMERFFRYFGQPQQQDEQERHGLGSGFLVGDGYVLTNNHVALVPDENRPGRFRPMDEITVQTDESSPIGAREFSAKVVGADDKSDIALLKLEGKDVDKLPAARLGDSDALEVGDFVIAIGEPFGLQATVTQGIVSAKERSQFGGAYSDYLQTDASINPGNSGGPLFNLRGEVIGVNAAIIQGANTIGFAIPIAVVKQLLPQLKQGKVRRGYMGVQLQALTQDMVHSLGLQSTRGALVADVVAKSPAERAGLKAGDVVVGLNGKPVVDNNQLQRDVGAIQPDHEAKLDVLRGGRRETVSIRLGGRPEESDDVKSGSSGRDTDKQGGDLLGLRVEDLTPELARRARVEAGTRGAIVTDVASDSPASTAGLAPGDLVLEANRQAVSSAAEYHKAVQGTKKGDTVLLRVRRGPQTQYVPVKVK